MSNKTLTLFEKRLADWEFTHPRQWITTVNERELANFIFEQTNKVVRAQLEAADRIIISQDRIADELSEISSGLSDISGGIEEIQSTLDWGFSEVIWQLELQTEVIKNILKVIQAPLDTQAKELKKRAEEAYRNGWIEDALEDFLESEKKNRYDFTIHQSLGNIYLFHKKSPEKALEYYEKAVKYATPYSPYHNSLALLHIGLIKYLQEDFQKAYEATLEAIKLSPDFGEAHYQHARYCAILGKHDEAIKYFWEAIKVNRYYCVKVGSEKDFSVMKGQLRSFFKERQTRAQDIAKKLVNDAQELIQDAESYGVSTFVDKLKKNTSYFGHWSSEEVEITEKFEATKLKLNEAKTFLKRGSLFDCWDAQYKVLVAQKMATDILIKFLSNQAQKIEERLGELIQKKNKRVKFNCGEFLIYFFLLFYPFFFWPLLAFSRFFEKWWWPFSTPFSLTVIPLVMFSVIYGTFYFASWINSLRYVPLVKRERKRLSVLKNNLSEVQAKQDRLQLEDNERNESNADQLERLFRKKYG